VVKVGAKAWKGPRAIRNLRWEGGDSRRSPASPAP